MTVIGLPEDVSDVCPLALGFSSLYKMGLTNETLHAKKGVQKSDQGSFPDNIPVIVTDMGCWPEAPGGVSNCRRDLVNGHSTIDNHVVAECNNEYGVLRYPVKKSVRSLKRLPLWGLDSVTADHGIINNLSQSQVDDKSADTHLARDVQGYFVPLLRTFVRHARCKIPSRASMTECRDVLVSMSEYFERKDYAKTWDSEQTEQAWIEAWIQPLDPSRYTNYCGKASEISLESPSLSDLREALASYRTLFFILSVTIPQDGDACPRVFQASHHGFGSMLGLVLKYRRGVNLAVWDHAILWRESLLHLSPAQSHLPLFVQSAMLAGMRLVGQLAYFHADVVMPCTSTFNPLWETEIGTDQGRLTSRQLFHRKIEPVVNGIGNMAAFKPTPPQEVQTTRPTVVMLSHVQPIKGIRPAIEAADVIVNTWGFRDYQLLIYGAIDQPGEYQVLTSSVNDQQSGYAWEISRLIVQRGLGDNVHLKGLSSDATKALKNAWIFMNSSLSEGLPLAVGEAGLTGVPLVVTDVGSTAQVLTDPETKQRKSASLDSGNGGNMDKVYGRGYWQDGAYADISHHRSRYGILGKANGGTRRRPAKARLAWPSSH
ncbi:uncharacterized protein ColSpa_12832 [Colletotrichum spaethianum]|uniref:Glycosyl transferase family 1 domain-containing protein n=1 Tax=Colletotrichum spaethianum TaxID=700344 RepID=A0AA37ULU3_9PEZI|nr:uncharacterized protein ColSpa_12832 [Colletotrichum spaethianum]GKT52651.1 hypothetical protein ColSpa_12832 [Colletotrichum spaethianum]